MKNYSHLNLLPYFIFILISCFAAPAGAADEKPASTAEQNSAAIKEQQLTNETFEAIDGLLDVLALRQLQLRKLTATPKPEDETLLKKREEEIHALQKEVGQIEAQLHAVTTGVEDKDYFQDSDQPVDIKAELEQLFQPFIFMLKSATEESRQIEELRRSLSEVTRQQTMASEALQGLEKLFTHKENATPEIIQEMDKYRTTWQERLNVSNDRVSALEQQLETKLAARESPAHAARKSFTGFFRERGISLLLGVGAFLAVLLLFRLIAFIFSRLSSLNKNNKPLSVPARAGILIFRIVSVIAATMTMLIIFNLRTDWLLLGIGAILLLGISWTLIKMLPDLMEQIGMLLNLGAVQEGERILYCDVPWRVKKIAYYSVLENKSLRGGNLALPVRELIGLHSRPVAKNECWFPTEENDWVLLDDNKIAQVILQTPEQVQLQKLGGSITTIPTPAFIENQPVNLSHGFRVEVEFGIDYKHQSQATDEILKIMRKHLEQELPKLIPENSLKNLEVEFCSTTTSSLNYEIEVDLDGSAAYEYEEISRIISRILVDACNANGWKIPFQQIMLHRAET